MRRRGGLGGVDGPARVADADEDRFEATVHPALVEDSSRRFRGYLEDSTIDKVSADVEQVVRLDD